MAPTLRALFAATLALTTSAIPDPSPGHRHHQHHAHLHSSPKRADGGYTPCTPTGWTDGMAAQWQGMMTQELAALTQETLAESLHHTAANNYAQAGFTCAVDSAFAPSDPWQLILDCPSPKPRTTANGRTTQPSAPWTSHPRTSPPSTAPPYPPRARKVVCQGTFCGM
ncbi:hypothetical protein CLAFUW4_10750 [Fulvia fulva]|nr:hypothetical protein CLAFUR4_10755 [Fulvia fulva]WPV19217.1 hypothetical protein CLAFUW4_10750 [Fulvia fulva]WPV34260.1 hypothetical protein CLAFUW7_10752 [Fulvia fulva]